MIVKKTMLLHDIKQILCDPLIYDTINDDNGPLIEEFEPPINNEYSYIGGYLKDEIFAVMIFHNYKDGKECHLQVLPEFRKEYAKDFLEQALKLCGTRQLYAEIPDLYQNVLNFALDNNFEVIERKQGGYIKSGIEYKINVLRCKRWDSLDG